MIAGLKGPTVTNAALHATMRSIRCLLGCAWITESAETIGTGRESAAKPCARSFWRGLVASGQRRTDQENGMGVRRPCAIALHLATDLDLRSRGMGRLSQPARSKGGEP